MEKIVIIVIFYEKNPKTEILKTIEIQEVYAATNVIINNPS